MLTGSRPDGTAFPGAPFPDMTCGNWTKSGTDGSAMTGHHDRVGPLDAPWATSWNSAHPTLGCSQERVRPTGGDGLFYCFALKQAHFHCCIPDGVFESAGTAAGAAGVVFAPESMPLH